MKRTPQNCTIADKLYCRDGKERYVGDNTSAKKTEIISNNKISMDCYMQGTIGDEVYLFDKTNKKQYRINLKNKTVSLSGNKSKGIEIYNNGKLTTGSAYQAAKKEITFNKYTVDNKLNGKVYAIYKIVAWIFFY